MDLSWAWKYTKDPLSEKKSLVQQTERLLDIDYSTKNASVL